jgi:hypothetical protein
MGRRRWRGRRGRWFMMGRGLRRILPVDVGASSSEVEDDAIMFNASMSEVEDKT